MRHSVNQSGFTLIELMVTIAIIAIIAGMAYPSMQRQIATMRLQNAVNTAEMMLKQARVEAMTTRQNITVAMTPSTSNAPAVLKVSKQQDFTFDSGVTVTQQNTGNITITGQKTAQGSSKSSPLPKYDFCYKDLASDKYTVSIDALTNVRVTATKGGCS
ncbi:putative pilin protein FimT [Moraxella macacae 0408225]|uniref:Putative pilin protein FimT n=1 Tax=Moraxella macacae 0408225 TaxID=1230338 RepID=L2FAJ0_9GAMM|nr:prepilin-type N-terminal cleavage/methylation domain-containing protein [Moraxella macacae]ELA09781.1 putative pilin protein FimT [Moraxella macacae 0408225]